MEWGGQFKWISLCRNECFWICCYISCTSFWEIRNEKRLEKINGRTFIRLSSGQIRCHIWNWRRNFDQVGWFWYHKWPDEDFDNECVCNDQGVNISIVSNICYINELSWICLQLSFLVKYYVLQGQPSGFDTKYLALADRNML